MTARPQEAILGLGTEACFNKMAQLICKDAPPGAEDAPMAAVDPERDLAATAGEEDLVDSGSASAGWAEKDRPRRRANRSVGATHRVKRGPGDPCKRPT